MTVTQFRIGLAAILILGIVALFVLVGGVFAQSPQSVRFAVIGDYGKAGQGEVDVSNLVKSWNPDFIITVGDNNYEYGEASTIDANIGQYYHDFISPYTGSYGAGASTNKFFPTLGNHDWLTDDAQAYFDFFTLPGNERYYEFVRGPVHFFVIDSTSSDGQSPTSTQGIWLQSALAASISQWNIVYFHYPPYSSSEHGSQSEMQWPFEAWGATAVLSGHDHAYERLDIDGFLYFVNGLGGRDISIFLTPVAGSQVRYNNDFGAMLVDADSDSIVFQFISVDNIVIDTYAINISVSPLQCDGKLEIVWTAFGNEETCYEDSTPITGITWDPPETITQDAVGSDNWPVTWGDDGDLYSCYGDGWGFAGGNTQKLSLGYVKISGPGDNWNGQDIHPSDGELVGGGNIQKKCSGMLMVEGRLWMWVRNADLSGKQCQLAYSDNYGVNWLWSTWKFEEFGHCSFVNYGQNYAGARDNYVYMVSHNAPNAYYAADGWILTRVPKDQILIEASYEFFAGLDGESPIWSSYMIDRQHADSWAGAACRSTMSYNAPLDRYMWWQQNGWGGCKRTQTIGFRVSEAPEPWGPWTVIYEAEPWDVDEGEQGNFPTKWMSEDGLEVYLVFSGDDAFSVRRGVLSTD